jgi:hypothetical protein
LRLSLLRLRRTQFGLRDTHLSIRRLNGLFGRFNLRLVRDDLCVSRINGRLRRVVIRLGNDPSSNQRALPLVLARCVQPIGLVFGQIGLHGFFACCRPGKI